jgi:hypothetical protein
MAHKAHAAHDDAMQRLEAGLLEQDRCSERYDAAIGTSSEVSAYARLRAAGARVAAQENWLLWVDDESYRGLNAGPFELLAESRLGGADDLVGPVASDRPKR